MNCEGNLPNLALTTSSPVMGPDAVEEWISRTLGVAAVIAQLRGIPVDEDQLSSPLSLQRSDEIYQDIAKSARLLHKFGRP